MLRSLTFGKFATAALLLALPLATAGCQSTGGWGWSPPSLTSLNPWRSSAANSSLASSKPSSSVPTPPATMLAGNGLARHGAGSSAGAPTYNANTYGGSRPTNGYNASTNDYAGRQVSATGEGYGTGRYNTGGSTAQQGPYGAGGAPAYGNERSAPGYGGAAAATADRRSAPAYGSGASGNAWQNYNSQQNSQPTNNATSGAGGNYQGAANSQSNPFVTGPSSSFAGTTGLSGSASRSSGAAPAGYGGDAYRPGSTARGSDNVQPASYDNQGSAGGYTSEGNYPTTSGGDTYQP
jgi:hypothetical protein